jgi:multidrug efflux pump
VNRVNLSEWSIRNRSVVVFLMIVIVAAGVLSFLRLGRAEDPVFTIRTMVAQAQWPGATLDETLLQVTERLERTLQCSNDFRGVVRVEVEPFADRYHCFAA